MGIDLNGMLGGYSDDSEAERHPINVFSRLMVEDSKNSKLYRECLRNEIDSMVTELSGSIDDCSLLILKKFMDMGPTKEDMEISDASELDKLRIITFREIVDRVFANRFLSGAGEEDDE